MKPDGFLAERWEYKMKRIKNIKLFSAVAIAMSGILANSTAAQQTGASDIVTVNINVVPFATLEFTDPNPLLYLEVPPPGSTIPSAGVEFKVIGNSLATLAAEPDSFMQIPAAQYPGISFDPYLGRAVQSGNEIGYDIELRFPIPGPNTGLPLTSPGAAVSPLVDVAGAGGIVGGVLHLIANPNWTTGGGVALPGLYEGVIVLTLTAN
ncbi:hypothetical protein [Roseinatronobacter bogoriensis]|uniref:DUF4402 domain-containing protein n=1 Tax=Roseinatronobacter bogoriensis subsp. barguzinensis TaxID=441209 RepID=A0A2K8KCZ1_9RHOB|nr:hypothetical protein [Rhodobaca]ATX65575.1 hypothetical protein BG454_06840 [Rhodobaca barguzinensis]MBB4208504.1 hypothetical protein [Rhodobaca bogoriensis DSM 18756]TDW39143.1 hypothetical protein LY39_02174 [Rhodobaca barguzinensis]TDY66463.1 hypothetical protein EV660_11173 [Rhodobaca bogoriensis DSM 18756]